VSTAAPGAPWAPLIERVISERYGGRGGPAAAALRLAWTHSLAASTYRTYGSKFKRFMDFCSAEGLCAIPAAATTLELYVGHLLSEGKVSAQYFPQYISAIRAVHRDLLLPRLIEQGRHEDLLKSPGGLYRRYASRQFAIEVPHG